MLSQRNIEQDKLTTTFKYYDGPKASKTYTRAHTHTLSLPPSLSLIPFPVECAFQLSFFIMLSSPGFFSQRCSCSLFCCHLVPVAGSLLRQGPLKVVQACCCLLHRLLGPQDRLRILASPDFGCVGFFHCPLVLIRGGSRQSLSLSYTPATLLRTPLHLLWWQHQRPTSFFPQTVFCTSSLMGSFYCCCPHWERECSLPSPA